MPSRYPENIKIDRSFNSFAPLPEQQATRARRERRDKVEGRATWQDRTTEGEKEMKEYRVVIQQESWLETIVEANSLEEAMELAQESGDWDNCDGEQATGSYEVYDTNGDCIAKGDDFEDLSEEEEN